MFAEYLATIESFINSFLDPFTGDIVSKVFDFIMEIFNFAA